MLYMDQKLLTFALLKVSEPWTARQSWHLSFITVFTTDFRHVAGLENVVADSMLQPSWPSPPLCAVVASPQQLDYRAITDAQRSCPSVEAAQD